MVDQRANLKSGPLSIGEGARVAFFTLVVLLFCATLLRAEVKVDLLRLPTPGVQPQAIMDAQNVLHLVYLTGEPKSSEVVYVQSKDEGKTFSKPIRVNSDAGRGLAVGAVRGPTMAVGSDGVIHVLWIGAQGMKLLHARSADGKSFEPQQIVSGKHPGLDGGGGIAVDLKGKVLIAWHAPEIGKEGEDNRRVWLAESSDSGKTFSEERAIDEKPRGACACCAVRIGIVNSEAVVVYRTAHQQIHRDVVLLNLTHSSTEILSKVNAPTCIMSTYGFGTAPGMFAWESQGKVHFAGMDAESFKPTTERWTVPGGAGQKYPAVANGVHTILIAWTEGAGFNRTGKLHWVTFERTEDDLKQVPGRDHPELPLWSYPAVFERRDGSFGILY